MWHLSKMNVRNDFSHTVTVTSGSSMSIMKRCRRLQGEKGKNSKEEGREGGVGRWSGGT